MNAVHVATRAFKDIALSRTSFHSQLKYIRKKSKLCTNNTAIYESTPQPIHANVQLLGNSELAELFYKFKSCMLYTLQYAMMCMITNNTLHIYTEK
jgi:hypothetical protein